MKRTNSSVYFFYHTVMLIVRLPLSYQACLPSPSSSSGPRSSPSRRWSGNKAVCCPSLRQPLLLLPLPPELLPSALSSRVAWLRVSTHYRRSGARPYKSVPLSVSTTLNL
jgi:hypothetical protein